MPTISTLAQQTLMLRSLDQLQGKAIELQGQISSGLVSQDISGLGLAAGRVANLQGSIQHHQAFLDTIATVQQRIQESTDVLSNVQSSVQKFQQLLPNGAYDTTPSDIQTQAKQLLGVLGDLLNTQDGSRYLFSGSLTGTAPFVAASLPVPGDLTTLVNGAPPSGYYAGNAAISTARVDDNLTINYGITADDPAIEKVIRTLNFLANLPPGSPSSSNATDVSNINQAAVLMGQGLQGLQNVLGTLALQSAAMKQVQQNHQDFVNLATSNIGSVESIDPAKAITELNQVETNLQASYATISGLQQLSLVNYLK
jgi:flagellar hook-associated protein 3 FlgL